MDIITKWNKKASVKTMDQAACDFIDAIQNTEEYKTYVLQRERIRQYPDLKQQIDEYRQKNYYLQTNMEIDDLFAETDKFLKEYEAFRDDPVVSEFLAAELCFCRMMQEVNRKITEAIDFD